MSNTSTIFPKKSNKIKYTLKSYDKLVFEDCWCSIPHSHPYCEIMIVTNGEGSFLGDQTQSKIQKGSIILTNPYISHTEFSSKDNGKRLEYTVISLCDICFYSEKSEKLLTSRVYDFYQYWSNITHYLNAIDKELAKKEAYWEITVKNIINNFLIFIIRITKLGNYNIIDTNISRDSHLIEVVKQYLQDYYPNNITLDDLSKRFFLNKFSLIRQFKQATGLTPIRYLENIRIEKAKQLILTTNFTIVEIAIQTGFSNAPYFSKKFKEITSLTPTQFLQKHKS